MKTGMQCKDVPDAPILEFLRGTGKKWATWGRWAKGAPTVADAMPEGTPDKVQVAKMRRLIERGLVEGCGCGCRGDYRIKAGP